MEKSKICLCTPTCDKSDTPLAPRFETPPKPRQKFPKSPFLNRSIPNAVSQTPTHAQKSQLSSSHHAFSRPTHTSASYLITINYTPKPPSTLKMKLYTLLLALVASSYAVGTAPPPAHHSLTPHAGSQHHRRLPRVPSRQHNHYRRGGLRLHKRSGRRGRELRCCRRRRSLFGAGPAGRAGSPSRVQCPGRGWARAHGEWADACGCDCLCGAAVALPADVGVGNFGGFVGEFCAGLG